MGKEITEDKGLIIRAQTSATAANIHSIKSAIAQYQNAALWYRINPSDEIAAKVDKYHTWLSRLTRVKI